MPRAIFRDKLGRTQVLEVMEGQLLSDALRCHGIPVNAVLTRVNDAIVPEEAVRAGPGDQIEFQQVRHYDLEVIRTPVTRLFGAGAATPVYVKSVLFDEGGDLTRRSEELGADAMAAYVEETFVQSTRRRQLLRADAPMVVGLSGGRDSVAFLKLLQRTRERLPPLRLTAVTVTGLPDWEEPATFDAARAACAALGIDHVIADASQIERVFQLSRPFVEVMSRIVGGPQSGLTMVIGHHVLRRMLEVEAERRGVDTIIFGFNADDLVASLVTWLTSGYRMGGIPLRRIGPFSYVYPLYRITKKELTLYLELVEPGWSRQGAPGRFTSGPGERSMAYAVADHLYDLWPGIDSYLFQAFETMQHYMLPLVESTCRVCNGIFVEQETLEPSSDLCDVCRALRGLEVTGAG